MKILFFSDIHGIDKNISYIKALIDKESFDKVIVLGDLFCKHPNGDFDECFLDDFISKYKEKLIFIRGNCDVGIDFELFLDDYYSFNDGCLKVICTHGHKDDVCLLGEANVYVYGHKHVPSIDLVDDKLFICVGSISLPRNNSEESYCIYENGEFIIYGLDGKVLDIYNTRNVIDI